MNNNFKFILLNKKDADIRLRIDQINHILTTHKPHFMILNEFQKHKYDQTSKNQFPGYKVEHDKLDILDGWARTAILIQNNLSYKRRHDLESPGISTVWLQIGTPGTKQFLLQGAYRQFQRFGMKGSISHPQQKARWNQLISNWEKATLEDREILTFGDMNLDSLVWDQPPGSQSSYDKQRQPLCQILKEKILSNGTTKINHEYTRHDNPPTGRKSCIDHAYSTHPEKINNIWTEHSTFSDHSMVVVCKRIKKMKITKKYLKIRSMKNYNKTTFKENLQNHHMYISTLYEASPHIISENITTMLQDSLEQMAPVTRIQLSNKNKQTLSIEAKQALLDRDTAYRETLESPSIQNTRHYKHLRNTANHLISRERHLRKKEKFQTETSTKQKWSMAKEETGQKIHSIPEQIREKGKVYTKPRDMAASLNRQYLANIRDTISKIPATTTNPLNLYKDAVGPVDSHLNIDQLTMFEFKKILRSLAPTTSTAKDFISMKIIKDAGDTINSHLLLLVNRIVATEEYPKELKLTKIVPIKKPEKDPQTASAWRPINIVPSLSKVVEKCLLAQVSKYLKDQNLIHHTHHGSVGGKSTQTLVQELYDILLTSLEQGDDMAFVQLDQSKAYDVIDHEILIAKMIYLGFNKKTIAIFRSYLSERRQYVVIDSFPSQTLCVGPRSVTQGSTLSCVLYIIYILDITRIYHNVKHTPKEYNDCSSTNAKSFVDDNFLLTKPKPGQTLEDSVLETMKKVEDYMNSNLLALNPDKTKIMIISTDFNKKKNFKVEIGGKELHHQTSLKVLGNIIADDLSWEKHVRSIVIPELANRARTLKYMSSFMNPQFKKVYARALFKGKLIFAIDAWGGVNKTLQAKVQAIQDRVTRSTLGLKAAKKSSYQREKELGWLSVQQEVIMSTHRMTHKIVYKAVPEELAAKMPLNTTNLRLKEAHKLDTKPKFLNKNLRTRSTFRSRAYLFNTLPNRLTAIEDPKKFSKWLKVQLRDPSKLPIKIPTIEEPKLKTNQTFNRRSRRGRPPKKAQPNQTNPSQLRSSPQRPADEVTLTGSPPSQFTGSPRKSAEDNNLTGSPRTKLMGSTPNQNDDDKLTGSHHP